MQKLHHVLGHQVTRSHMRRQAMEEPPGVGKNSCMGCSVKLLSGYPDKKFEDALLHFRQLNISQVR